MPQSILLSKGFGKALIKTSTKSSVGYCLRTD